eukprot:5772115-Amphidinium_carterae.1
MACRLPTWQDVFKRAVWLDCAGAMFRSNLKEFLHYCAIAFMAVSLPALIRKQLECRRLEGALLLDEHLVPLANAKVQTSHCGGVTTSTNDMGEFELPEPREHWTAGNGSVIIFADNGTIDGTGGGDQPETEWRQVAFCQGRVLLDSEVQSRFQNDPVDAKVTCPAGDRVFAWVLRRNAAGALVRCKSMSPDQACSAMTALQNVSAIVRDECLLGNMQKNFGYMAELDSNMSSTTLAGTALRFINNYCARSPVVRDADKQVLERLAAEFNPLLDGPYDGYHLVQDVSGSCLLTVLDLSAFMARKFAQVRVCWGPSTRLGYASVQSVRRLLSSVLACMLV